MSDRRSLRKVAAAVVFFASGCCVGPNFRPPHSETPPEWVSWAGAESRPGVTSRPVSRRADVATWWNHLDDPELTSLIERAMRGNLGLEQARARVCQARAARAAAAGQLWPQVSVGGAANRTGDQFDSHSFYRAGFDASWEIDIFGGLRRGVEAATADVVTAERTRDATMVSLAAEVGAAYLDIRGAQRQLAIARQNLTAQQQTLDLTKERFDAGFVSMLDVANARGQVAATGSQIPSFEARLQGSIYALSVLLGEQPGALVGELAPESRPGESRPSIPRVPSEIPIGLPSELLLRRPDVASAEAQLHAATARVGVAISGAYPRFSLTGAFGTQSTLAGEILDLANRAWSIGPSFSVPVITGGITQANIAQARAVACSAFLAYKSSVLVALQEVETALVNFTNEQRRLLYLAESVDANRQAVDLSIQQYSAGKTAFLDVLSAQRSLYVTEASLQESEIAVATNLIALYKALGGGWDAP